MILSSVCEASTPIMPALLFAALAVTLHVGANVAIRSQKIEIANQRNFAVGQILVYGAAILSWLVTGLRFAACGH